MILNAALGAVALFLILVAVMHAFEIAAAGLAGEWSDETT